MQVNSSMCFHQLQASTGTERSSWQPVKQEMKGSTDKRQSPHHSTAVTSRSTRAVLCTEVVTKRSGAHDASDVRDERWQAMVNNGAGLVLRVSIELHARARCTEREAHSALESVLEVARLTTAIN